MQEPGENPTTALPPLVRSLVQARLNAAPSFHELPVATQHQIAHDMVQVATYMVGGETGKDVPAAALLVDAPTADALLFNRLWLSTPAPGDFAAAAAGYGGRLFADLVSAVDFPAFVAGLIDGVFDAIVDATIQQLRAYADLLQNVARSVDQFMDDRVTEGQARDYLAAHYSDLVLQEPAGAPPGDFAERTLVPAARRRMAMDRQGLLATMVLMGIRRMVVSHDAIDARVLFLSDDRARPVRGPVPPQVIIRDETAADAAPIGAVTAAAFATLEISSHTEQYIVDALRRAGALAVSLVAELDGRVIGHIAFSPVTISDGTRGWYGLGPVSVLPAYQRQGIGKALIRAGLARLAYLHGRGCCLVGHPDYYDQFGFRHVPGLEVEGVPPEVFFALSFDGHYPQGAVAFHEGFRADGRPDGAGLA
jgi:putative acetyltransferase